MTYGQQVEAEFLEELTMTHAEQIIRAVASLVHDGADTFSRREVRDRIGVSHDTWMLGYTAVFQGMRVDHPGGAPSVADRFKNVFQQVSHGSYKLTRRGKEVIKQFDH
jgi:hypothetical protein